MLTYQDIINQKNKEESEKLAILAAWENVKRQYKKNGGAFALLSKNYTGVSFLGGFDCTNNQAYIHTWANSVGYVTDSIYLYLSVNYSDDKRITEKPQNVVDYQFGSVYVFDLDDIDKAIQDRIDYLKKYIKDLQESKKTIKAKLEKIDTFFQELKADYKDDFDRYTIREYIEKNAFSIM